MKNLKIDETKAKQLYKTASSDFKQILYDTFGEEFFNDSLFDRIKTIDDVYESLGENKPTLYNFKFLPVFQRKKALYHAYIGAIEKVFNEDWSADWNNHTQQKYYPYFENKKSSGWVLYGSYYYFSYSDGQPAYFKDEKTALFVGETFLKEYFEYLNN